MCIAYLALETDSSLPLFIAANRDESHARPTRAAAPWPDAPTIIGGQDLEAGGTWFAVQRQGRFALLTNYRDMLPATGLEHSRGDLCKDFLLSELSAQDYMHQIAQQAHQYQGFNLIVGQWDPKLKKFDCYYYSNRSEAPPEALAAGHYVVSNHLLNTPWPKSQRLQQRLRSHLEQQKKMNIDTIYDILRDEQKAPIADLPNTGLNLAQEHLVSSPFIISSEYGTRSSSIWAVDQSGYSTLHECSYNTAGVETERHSWPLIL